MEDLTGGSSKQSARTTVRGTYTPEPWHQSGVITQIKRVIDIGADDNSNVAQCLTGDNVGGDDIAKANARRIVACVHACKGIPTDGLEKLVAGLADQPIAYVGMKQQRDELADALRGLLYRTDTFYGDALHRETVEQRTARALLAKVDASTVTATAVLAK